MTKRTEDGKWAKGQSGNPGGRRKGEYQVKDLAREFTQEAVRRLAFIMRQDEDLKAAVAATNSLLDRGWGKPAQSVDVTNSDGSLSAAWLAAMRAVDSDITQAEEALMQH